MKFTKIGEGGLSSKQPDGKRKIILKINDTLLPLVAPGKGIWLKSAEDSPDHLIVEAHILEIEDFPKPQAAKPEELNASHLEKLLKTATEMKQQSSDNSSPIETTAFSAVFLFLMTEILCYLIKNQNVRVFIAWLKNNQEIDVDIKNLIFDYLRPLEERLGGL